MPNWEAEALARRTAREDEDRERRKYVAKRLSQDALERERIQVKLAQNQQIAADFIKSTGFNTVVRQVLLGFHLSHSVTEWLKGQSCPLGGEMRIGPDHTPAFVLEARGIKCLEGAPGYTYCLSFGVERRVQVTATVCLEPNGKPYLYVHLENIDGRTHESTWDNTLVLKFNSNVDKDKLSEWLKKEIALSGVKEPVPASTRVARIFYPD